MELSEQYRGCIGLSLIVFFIKSGPRGLSKLFFLIELYCIIFFDILLFLFRNIPLMEDVDFLMRLNKKKDLKQLNFPIFISSRKWERTNIFLQAIKNWHFRRRWLKGESLKSIYSDYYKK